MSVPKWRRDLPVEWASDTYVTRRDFTKLRSWHSQSVPVKEDEHGVLRVAGTRVTLDSVVYAFRNGATAEEILQKYPSLDLAGIYALITFSLRNREAVDEHIQEEERAFAALRTEVDQATGSS